MPKSPSRSVVGVVLAAGLSRRMGRSKALLHAAPTGETFVARLARTLVNGGVSEVLVIGRPGDHPLRAAVGRLDPAVRFVENPGAEQGQLSSLLIAIEEAERIGREAVLVMPVDMPLVAAETVAAAIAAFTDTGAPIVRVTHRGRHGHPVIFSARVFEALRRADISIGAKAVLRNHAAEVRNLEVDDPGVLRDVDFVDDYREMFGRDPE